MVESEKIYNFVDMFQLFEWQALELIGEHFFDIDQVIGSERLILKYGWHWNLVRHVLVIHVLNESLQENFAEQDELAEELSIDYLAITAASYYHIFRHFAQMVWHNFRFHFLKV